MLNKEHICPNHQEKNNATKTQKCELMQELPKGCNNIFIMGDLQKGTLETPSLPQKAFREASGHWSSPELNQRPPLALEQHNSSAAPQAQESRLQLLIDRFTWKYPLQRGRGATGWFLTPMLKTPRCTNRTGIYLPMEDD